VTDRGAIALPRRPRVPIPAGACDAHAHVFGDPAVFPLVSPVAYPVPDAPAELHYAVARRLGLDRGVLVQPAVYGEDHRAMIDAMALFPGRLRGVGLGGAETGDDALDRLHAAGVRALRFVEMRVPGTGRRFPGSVPVDALATLHPKLADRGWHAEIWAPPEACAAIARNHASDAVPLVFDHLAGAGVDDDPNDDAYRRLRATLERGRIWIKLSICRIGPRRADYPRARRFHTALAAANPERLVWGSDFPFLRKGAEAPDGGWLLDRCREWLGTDALFHRILVTNPAKLYSFEGDRHE